MRLSRLAWIDALRVVDAALVVLVHADYLARPDPFTWWPLGIYSILPFGLCVPLFFGLAGFVSSQSTARALADRALRFVPLVVAHGIVLLLLGVRDEATATAQAGALVLGVWYLYFLSALVQILVVHACVERWFAKHRRAVLAAAVLVTVLSYVATSANLWLRGSDLGALETRLRSFGTTWAAFYALGVALGRNAERFAQLVRNTTALVLVTVLCAIPFVGEVFAEDAHYGHATTMQLLASGLPYQLAGTVSAMAVAAKYGERRSVAFLAKGAPVTLAVYLLHGTALFALYRAWLRAGAIVHPLEVPALASLAIAAALVVRAIASFLPRPLPWLLAGVTRARPYRRP